MTNPKPCPVCQLPPELQALVEDRLDLGLSYTEIAQEVQKHPNGSSALTARNVDNHKRHRMPKQPQKPPQLPCALECLQKPTKAVELCAEKDLEPKEVLARLRNKLLNAVDILSKEFEESHSIKVARVLREMGEAVYPMVRDWEQEDAPEEVLTIQVTSLEENMITKLLLTGDVEGAEEIFTSMKTRYINN